MNPINVVKGLANITNTVAVMKESSDGRPYGEITFTTSEGVIAMTLEQFTGMYKGMVGAFPAITPVKDEVRQATISFNASAKAGDKSTKETEKAEKRALREASRLAKIQERADKAKLRSEAATAKVEAAKAKATTPIPTPAPVASVVETPKGKGGRVMRGV